MREFGDRTLFESSMDRKCGIGEPGGQNRLTFLLATLEFGGEETPVVPAAGSNMRMGATTKRMNRMLRAGYCVGLYSVIARKN